MNAMLAKALLAMVVVSGAVVAQPDGNRVTVGAGVMMAPRYEGSGAMKVLPIPMVDAQYMITPQQRVFWRGIEAGYGYGVNDRVEVGLTAGWKGGREADDGYEVQGLAEIDDSVEVGPFVRYAVTDNVSLQASAKTDVTGNGHDGTTAQAKVAYGTVVGRGVVLGASAGVTVASENYMENTFAVPAVAARVGRPAYDADAGFHSVNVGASMVYPLQGNWSVLANVGADYLVGDAADSPLVEQELQPRVLVGVGYTF